MPAESVIQEAIRFIPGGFIHHYQKSDWGGNLVIIEQTGAAIARVYWFDDRKHFVYLDWLSVSETHRNKGMGTNLQIIREDIGRVFCATHSWLWVKNDTWMIYWYKRRGYVYTGPFEKEDAIWMKKAL
jgi:hypothetical protein